MIRSGFPRARRVHQPVRSGAQVGGCREWFNGRHPNGPFDRARHQSLPIRDDLENLQGRRATSPGTHASSNVAVDFANCKAMANNRGDVSIQRRLTSSRSTETREKPMRRSGANRNSVVLNHATNGEFRARRFATAHRPTHTQLEQRPHRASTHLAIALRRDGC